jgi:hypothetical protein
MRTQLEKNILMTREEYEEVIDHQLAWMSPSQVDEMGGFMTYEKYVEKRVEKLNEIA